MQVNLNIEMQLIETLLEKLAKEEKKLGDMQEEVKNNEELFYSVHIYHVY